MPLESYEFQVFTFSATCALSPCCRQPFSMEARVHFQVSECGICCAQIVGGFSKSVLFFPLSLSFHQCSVLVFSLFVPDAM